MSETIRVITNNHRREVIQAYELNQAERNEFDYVNWPAVDNGETSRTFVRYQGQLVDLNDLEQPFAPSLPGWDAYRSDSFFSGLVARWVEDDQVVVGRYLA